jgi:hypothetical protein
VAKKNLEIFKIKMSKEKLSNLKKQLQEILQTTDEDGTNTPPDNAGTSQPLSAQASTSTGFASRAINNFRCVFYLIYGLYINRLREIY